MKSWVNIRSIAIITMCSCAANLSQAQSVDEINQTKGIEHRHLPNSSIQKLLQADKNGILSVRIKGGSLLVSTSSKLLLEEYDSKYAIKRSKESPLKYKGKRLNFEEAFLLKEKCYLFTSFPNQKTGLTYLFAQKINRSNLTVDKKLVFLDEMPSSNFNSYEFSFSISPDSNFLLVYQPRKGKRNEPGKYSLRVFDSQLKEKWSQVISLPGRLSNSSIDLARVDNDGKVYLLVKALTDNRVNSPEESLNKIVAINEQGMVIQEFPIKLNGLIINGANFKINNQEQLICAGYYSERGINSVKGVFYMTIDLANNKVINTSAQALPFDVVARSLSEPKRSRLRNSTQADRMEVKDVNLDHIILRGDGGAMLLGEQFDSYEISDFDMMTNIQYNRTVYEYNDIIAVSINSSGAIDWASRIPKQQVTTDDNGRYSSYMYEVTKDKLLLLYNDNDRNVGEGERPINPRNFDGYSGVVAYSIIDSEGHVTSGGFTRKEDDGFMIRPFLCKQISQSKMLVFRELGRRYYWGTISLN